MRNNFQPYHTPDTMVNVSFLSFLHPDPIIFSLSSSFSHLFLVESKSHFHSNKSIYDALFRIVLIIWKQCKYNVIIARGLLKWWDRYLWRVNGRRKRSRRIWQVLTDPVGRCRVKRCFLLGTRGQTLAAPSCSVTGGSWEERGSSGTMRQVLRQ